MKAALAVVLAVVALAAGPAGARPGPAHVEVVARDGGFALLRDGAPYVIRGAGGDGSLEALAAAGGNSVRTWGVGPDTPALLDEAAALGLTVTVGLWLGHPRHGFDYGDEAAVRAQLERARADVLRLKDHPALLLWGVGNEMEGFEKGDDPRVWDAVDAVAAMIAREDPHHPPMVVTAEIGGERVAMVEKRCPHVAIHGINSYGGLPSLAERYRAAGGTKPWIVTEFGPPGVWELPKPPFGGPAEPTSTAKAAAYRRGWEAIAAAPGSLGGYAFTWGAKREVTATWYGMFLASSEKLGAVDALTELWTGRPPEDRCPTIGDISLDGGQRVLSPGDRVTARVTAEDPDGDALAVTWELRGEAPDGPPGGDESPPTRAYPEALAATPDGAAVEVALPAGRGGLYRLYAVARDGRGGAAVATLPLTVDGPDAPPPAPQAELPLVVYGDGAGRDAPYAPSGWMGEVGAIAMDPADTSNPALGATSLRVDYRTGGGWGGVVWQSPAGDWGDRPGGLDLSGAQVLSVWARGARGGERVTFLVGLLGPDKPFHDSARRTF
ncbi:MAG: hypothetical protein H6745_33730, partial [Deltaproteobacteria bacterium]|nr:hypothetical protein [Deltaproteobacteria bacterium]